MVVICPLDNKMELDGVDDTMQIRPRVVLVNGCEVPGVDDSGNVTSQERKVEDMDVDDKRVLKSASNEVKRQELNFNEVFPDEILSQIFQHIWRPEHRWDTSLVCKRWFILLACSELQKRSSNCIGLNRGDRSGRKSYCARTRQVLNMKRVQSEWRLAMDFVTSCKQHTHALEIKDCTHLSFRVFHLISGFATSLQTIRLQSCNSIDDATLDGILNRALNLRTIHLTMVPKLALKNMEKAIKLQELQVYGCPNVTLSTVISILKGCPNLKSLSLSALGVTESWDDSMALNLEPLKLQKLELTNTLAITDSFLQAISKFLPHLRKLDLSRCRLITDDGLLALIGSCGPKLQKVVLTRLPGITDVTAKALAIAGDSLQDLYLSGTDLSDDGLQVLLDSSLVSRKLRSLSLASCRRITDRGLLHIVRRRTQLVSFKVLDVQGCLNLSGEALKKFPKKFTNRSRVKLIMGIKHT